ncbi:SusC/RagA family TonB-linked outer membrane protein [Pollutibacter soli]|uniref:SusC/RagA family TonB-linked outer membrane protein n=1 Tax=Pollutibacter soli TaxID=3034157 RepID=UPI003013B949
MKLKSKQLPLRFGALIALVGIVLQLMPFTSTAQEKIVIGRVNDKFGAPVAGVSVTIGNTNRGTTTDAAGSFSISAAPGATLNFSITGYKSQQLKVGTEETINITLEEDVARLDEVIVTGLTTNVKRSNLSNTVATISNKQLVGIAPAQTLDAAINGKISGAYINANSGSPGGGITVKLRGVTSVYGNTQPLYVIDGVFVDNSAISSGLNTVTNAAPGAVTSNQDNASNRIADIRAEDIEHIEILKGASASAIYGSKAAAGVILITTKKGKQGRTRINFSQDIGVVTVRHLMGLRPMTEQAVGMMGWDMAEFKAAEAAGKIYDYEKEIFGETGFLTNSVLSLTGGTEKTTFYFSGAYRKEDGIVKRTGYENTGFRLNVDHRLSDRVKLGLTTNYIHSSADRGLQGNDNTGITLGIALSSTPSFTELHPDANGNYPRNRYAASNPLETRDKMRNNETTDRFISGLTFDALLQQSVKSNTRLIVRGGLDFYNQQTDLQFPSSLQFQEINKGTSIQGFTKNINTNYIASLINQLRPSEHLLLTTSIGATQETRNFNNLINVATQVISGQSNVDQAGALTATQFRTKVQDNGFFVQEEALIKDAISLTAGIRFDCSSNNGDTEKFYAYPKAGASVNLTRLGLFDGGIMDNLKIRAAYGQAGNSPAYGSKFTTMAVSNIGGLPGSVVNVQRGEPNIEPERQTEFEAGVDFSFFRGRLGFELTYYNKTIFDFLLLRTLPASSGFTTQWVNAGDLRNQGVELGLSAQPVATQNFKWNTTVNFWLNRSKVTRLDIPPVVLGSFGEVLGVFRIEEGKSATQIVGLTDEPGYMPPVKAWGNQEPTFQMNTFNEITYKNKLSFRFLVHWKKGGQNVNLTRMQYVFGGMWRDWDKDDNKSGMPDGLEAIMTVGSTAREFIQNSDYLRVREMGLYYAFDKLPVKAIKRFSIGVSLNNFITFTKYDSYDPEASNFGTGFSSGIDVLPYPASKRATLHLSFDF